MAGQTRSPVFSPLLRFFTFVLVSNVWLSVQALRNITIDNSDPTVSYHSDDWSFDDSYASSATDHWSSISGASASVPFTGVAVYYQVHLYPSGLHTGALLSVDNYAETGVVMWDPDNDDYGDNFTDVWSMTGLPNGTHTLNVKFWDNGDNDYITLDTILVTQLEEGETAPNPTFNPISVDVSQTASGAESSSTSNFNDASSDNGAVSGSSSSNKALPIALGTVFGVLFLAAAIAAGFFFNRYRKNRAARTGFGNGNETNLLLSGGGGAPPPSAPAPAPAPFTYEPYNPNGGTQMQQQSLYAASNPTMSQYGYPVPMPAGTEPSTNSFHSPSPDSSASATHAPTMSRLINDPATMGYPLNAPTNGRLTSAFSSSQSSLYGPGSSVPGGAQMSSRLPEV
ncbi:hypothetical protein K435DRAFT_88089 [Dendrothele bispora CBS 962.96]|uniref:Mid2 domain-containing protein n=1 Tax=Dendrothele bispora (strain CBS 962.96) TaxID=1314807 RepID=A0A4S8KPJ2_DENBC|nr:hypothetical protein K435DRAFT_88089 [Dendrothele bispora CBS 962.96]